MDHFEQLRHLNHELDMLVDRVRKEYEMSYEAVIGALTLKAHHLCAEAMKQEYEPDEPTD